jgi:hypothetical protein
MQNVFGTAMLSSMGRVVRVVLVLISALWCRHGAVVARPKNIAAAAATIRARLIMFAQFAFADDKNITIRPVRQRQQLCTALRDQHTMLYLIGLGLSDETDITVKGLEVVKKASRVYLEAYTSILLVDKDVLVCFLYTDLQRRS